MFKEFESSKIIDFYETLEGKFLDFLKVVPPHDQNQKTWSPDLADILVGSCSLLDSIFRMSSPEVHKGVKQKDFDINTYCDLYSGDLVSLRSLVYTAPPQLISPYGKWTMANSPRWWQDYNQIKHGRLNHMEFATSETTMYALCGLFEAISQNQNLSKALIRHSWVGLSGYNPDIIVPKLDSMKLNDAVGDPHTFLVQSKLFVTTLGPNKFPDNINKIQPGYYLGGEKLISFLGKWIEHYNVEK